MPDIAPIQYARLPGSGIARKGGSFLTVTRTSCRLWLGDDHLLQVESVGGYSETYKRFYFRDIQAITLQKTNFWLVANFVLGVITGLLLLWMLLTQEVGGKIFIGIMAGVFGFFFLLNLIHGSTCRCLLKTAVHFEELPSLRRRRNADKVLNRVKPLIEAAQGSSTADIIEPQYAALLAGANATPAAAGQFSRVADPSLTPYRSRAHQILFLTLAGDALASVLNIFLPSVPVVMLQIIIGGVTIIAVIAALVKQNQTDLRTAVRAVTWIAAGFIGLSYLAGYGIMMVMASERQLDGTQWGYIKALASLHPFETTWWMVTLCVSTAISALLATTGLLFLQQHWRAREIGA